MKILQEMYVDVQTGTRGRGSRGGRGRAGGGGGGHGDGGGGCMKLEPTSSVDDEWSPASQQQSTAAAAATATAAAGDQLVITECTHRCGYADCDKRFRFKHDLLRHQTKLHGRLPVRARDGGPVDEVTSHFSYSPLLVMAQYSHKRKR